MKINKVKISNDHWESFHCKVPRMKLPTKIIVTTKNLQNLLRKKIKPGMKVIEIGFAPGKQLAYIKKKYGAEVTGIDKSKNGINLAKKLFNSLKIEGNIICGDILHNTIKNEKYDLVYSVGVIEHFDDPKPLVENHFKILKNNGVAIIIIPNYKKIYGKIQKHFHPDNLNIHNLEIMELNNIKKLASNLCAKEIQSYYFGMLDQSLISWEKKIPYKLSLIIKYILNIIGIFQPFFINVICPWIVLEIRK
jgi:2-polyprenyl-3-methyl-5-hydroxy-6-metoxy-1,4-benzoquinol methylase